MHNPATDVVRVEKGRASEEELAAVTALLMARAAAHTRSAAPLRPRRTPAPWRRPERVPTYRAPHSWQH
ncbi:acyl-CoA carboxylase subunit epsilon [Streptomyces megasporus]|uniref:acyl-CoA carboxylase subunit epsilon n=1 Tax=Streptomyces megasporus TaxID=44060 RepID=UPI0004E2551E|nr:acyl-CoA carboxylase subunit epsilon [Streptomyces megasporus]